MAKVTAESVRDRLNLTAADIPDAVLEGMISDAAAALGLELGYEIHVDNRGEAEAAAVKNLAAIYALCHLSGGSAAGLNFNLGDLRVEAVEKAPSLEILYRELERLIERLRKSYMGMV